VFIFCLIETLTQPVHVISETTLDCCKTHKQTEHNYDQLTYTLTRSASSTTAWFRGLYAIWLGTGPNLFYRSEALRGTAKLQV